MKYKLYFDGCCKPTSRNGIATYGYYVVDENDQDVVKGKGVASQRGTNNEAEYAALFMGLTSALKSGAKNIDVYGDSMLVIMQMTGEWRIKKAHLARLVELCQSVVAKFDTVNFEWIPREQNTRADMLSNMAYFNHQKTIS